MPKFTSLAACFALSVGIFLGAGSANAEEFVFIVNATVDDQMGPSTAAYLDEARWAGQWKTALERNGVIVDGRKRQIIPIRAHSNDELTRALARWMRALPTDLAPRQVLGLGVYSHGEPMTLRSESEKFKVHLSADVRRIFGPLIGRFVNGAHIAFMGCNILEGQSETEVATSLAGLADSFGLNRGFLYANATKGFDPYVLFSDPFNSDVKPLKRAAAFVAYLFWPLTATVVPVASRYVFNHGWQLMRFDHDVVVPMRFQTALANSL